MLYLIKTIYKASIGYNEFTVFIALTLFRTVNRGCVGGQGLGIGVAEWLVERSCCRTWWFCTGCCGTSCQRPAD